MHGLSSVTYAPRLTRIRVSRAFIHAHAPHRDHVISAVSRVIHCSAADLVISCHRAYTHAFLISTRSYITHTHTTHTRTQQRRRHPHTHTHTPHAKGHTQCECNIHALVTSTRKDLLLFFTHYPLRTCAPITCVHPFHAHPFPVRLPVQQQQCMFTASLR